MYDPHERNEKCVQNFNVKAEEIFIKSELVGSMILKSLVQGSNALQRGLNATS